MFFNPWKKPAPPTLHDLAAQELYEAEVALLEAEAEHERAKHNKAMMLERVERLRALRRTEELAAPGIPLQLIKAAA